MPRVLRRSEWSIVESGRRNPTHVIDIAISITDWQADLSSAHRRHRSYTLRKQYCSNTSVKVRISTKMEYCYFDAWDQNSDIPLSPTKIFHKR